jgi:hypothetical protein
VQGLQGIAGVQAAKGDQGDQGLQGVAGLQGDQGLCGADESSAGGATTARCAGINTDQLDASSVAAENVTITGVLEVESIRIGSLELQQGQSSVSISETGSSLKSSESELSATAEAAKMKSGASRVVVNQESVSVSGASVFLEDSSGLQRVSVDANRASVESSQEVRVIVRASNGSTSGLVVTPSETTLSGGTNGSTTIRLDDNGVTLEGVSLATTNFSNLAAPAPASAAVPIHNLADGTAALDAVNKRQLDAMYAAASSQIQAARDDALRGVAISNAMEVFLPDPGKRFRLNFGMGYYKSASAIAITGSGRITEDIGIYLGVGSDTALEDVGGKAGLSLQW